MNDKEFRIDFRIQQLKGLSDIFSLYCLDFLQNGTMQDGFDNHLLFFAESFSNNVGELVRLFKNERDNSNEKP